MDHRNGPWRSHDGSEEGWGWRRVAVLALTVCAGCAKPRTADLLTPASGVTSVAGRCLQVDNATYPENRAFVYVESQSQAAQTTFSVGNFGVAEEGKPAPVLGVQAVDNGANPLYAAVVMDQSGSMSGTTSSGANRMTVAKTAAKAFVAALGGADQCEVVLFDNTITVQQTFTSNQSALNAAIDAAIPGGGTASYDACAKGVGDVGAKRGRKVVILLTDGDDNSSATYTSPAKVADYANTNGLAVYTIGVVSGGGFSDPSVLKTIATNSGGEYFGDDQGDLSAQFQRIAYQLNNLVEITFRSLVTKRPRTLKVFLTYGPLTATFERAYSF